MVGKGDDDSTPVCGVSYEPGIEAIANMIPKPRLSLRQNDDLAAAATYLAVALLPLSRKYFR